MNQPEGPGLPGPSSGSGPRTEHGDFHYDIAATTRAGKQRVHPYALEEPLEVGQIVRLEGRYWLIESIEDSHAAAKPARYRLKLRHPDGGHGWMCRLVDSGALTAAGFQRVRKATLDLLEP